MAIELSGLVLPAFEDLPGLPSEADALIEHLHPSETYVVDGIDTPVAVTEDGIGVVQTGVGKVAAATTVTSLVSDETFELDETIVLSAGIAGGPPTVSIGSIVVASSIVDWDNKLRFDEPTGDAMVPIAENPYNERNAVIDLEPDLVEAAVRAIDQPDLDVVVESAATEAGLDVDAPSVHVGTNLCGDELFHGRRLADQADWLVEAHERSPYLATEMEDIGTAVALRRFGHLERYLSIRAISNPDRPTADGGSLDETNLAAGASVALPALVSAVDDVLEALVRS